MSVRDRVESAATVAMACCAVLMTGLYVRSQFFAQSPDPAAPQEQGAWRKYAEGDMRIGSDSAPVIVTEFSDFQCPYCYNLYRSLERLRRKYPGKISIIYRNYPIDQLHPVARAAGRAAVCAARLGSFESFYSYLFEHRDSLASGQWSQFAKASGIRDTMRFTTCLRDPQIAAQLLADSIAAEELQIRGTPMFLVNKWQFFGNPPEPRLDSIIRAELRMSSR